MSSHITSETPRTGLGSLPNELLARILGNVDWRSVLQCSKTCKLLHDVVQTTAALRYKVELGCAGFEDTNQNEEVSCAERLERLNNYSSAWREMSVSEPVTIRMDGCGRWDYVLQGGYLFRVRVDDLERWPSKSDILIVRLPTTDYPTASMRKHELDFQVTRFVVDINQTLVAFVDDSSSDTPRIHLLSLIDFKDHPSAARRVLESGVKRGRCPALGIQIAGHLLGILFLQKKKKIQIWDWVQGIIISELQSDTAAYLSFIFLSESALLVMNEQPFPPSLEVYVIKEPGRPPEHVTSFVLPQLKDGSRINYFIMNSGPSSLSRSRKDHILGPSLYRNNGRTPHLMLSEDARMLSFEIDIIHDRQRHERHALYAHAFMFLLTTAGTRGDETRPAKSVPWQEWGPRCTRATRPDLGGIFNNFLFGWRSIIREPVHVSTQPPSVIYRAVLLDFNPFAVRREAPRDTNIEGTEIVQGESSHRTDTVFWDNMVTCLPYRKTTFPVDGILQGVVMIDRDRMINITKRWENRGHVDTLHVYQIVPSTEMGRA